MPAGGQHEPAGVLSYKKTTKRVLDGQMAPQVGLEPTTLRLTAECSAIELLRNIGMRQRPTLPGRLQPSTIGVLRLNFCVRNGNRWNPQAITTANRERCQCVTGSSPDDLILILPFPAFSFLFSKKFFLFLKLLSKAAGIAIYRKLWYDTTSLCHWQQEVCKG